MISKTRQTRQITTRSRIDQVKLLHIDNSQADIQRITEQLQLNSRLRCIIENSKSLSQAMAVLSQKKFDVVFLDLNLTDSTGIITLEKIRKIDINIPIIVISSSYDDALIDDIIRCGGQDYIPKSDLNIKFIDRTIRYAIERKKTEYELELLAHYDPLTKLYNRAIFMDRLKHSLLNIKRLQEERYVVTMLLDLDNFKTINDTMGHAVGDALLIQVANRLKSCVRETDTVARLGGDEFTIFFENVEQLNTITGVANKILAALSEPFLIDNTPISTSASIGVSSSDKEKNFDAETILKNSDIAMYTAKNKGGNQVGFFTRELQITAQIRTNLEKNLRIAIEKDQLQLFFQPQINLETGKLYGIESLVRWMHPQHGLIPPNGFLPALEETGLIIPATEWIITRALTLWEEWLEKGIIDKEMHISINIPPRFINQHKIVDTIETIADKFKFNRQQIEFELIENAFIDITPKNLQTLTTLKEKGFRLAIDDFGTGYSSLGYLKAFPIDCIKLDRMFVKDIIHSPKDEAIAEAMINLCQKLGINLIAEGVDSLEKLEKLKSLQCKIIQGFHFSKVLSSTDFETYATNYKIN